MIRTLLTTTALAALLSTGAMAQTASDSVRSPLVLSEGYAAIDGDNLASKVLGATVYTSTSGDADKIGDINDFVIDGSGDIAAAVIGVGGFLGVGEKNVAVDFAELKWSTADDGTWRYVLATTADALKSAPEFIFDEETAADQANNVDGNATPVATPNTTTDTDVVPLDRTKLNPLDPSTLTSEDVKGIAVYGVNDDQIGSIGDFVLDPEGKIDAVIIDVGGFLGLGKKPVAVGFENLSFSVDADNKRYLFINTTKEQLEAQPEFNRDVYANERQTQRLVVTP